MTRPRPFQNAYKDRHLRHKNIEPSEEAKNARASAGLALIEKGEKIQSPWLRRVLRRLGKK